MERAPPAGGGSRRGRRGSSAGRSSCAGEGVPGESDPGERAYSTRPSRNRAKNRARSRAKNRERRSRSWKIRQASPRRRRTKKQSRASGRRESRRHHPPSLRQGPANLRIGPRSAVRSSRVSGSFRSPVRSRFPLPTREGRPVERGRGRSQVRRTRVGRRREGEEEGIVSIGKSPASGRSGAEGAEGAEVEGAGDSSGGRKRAVPAGKEAGGATGEAIAAAAGEIGSQGKRARGRRASRASNRTGERSPNSARIEAGASAPCFRSRRTAFLRSSGLDPPKANRFRGSDAARSARARRTKADTSEDSPADLFGRPVGRPVGRLPGRPPGLREGKGVAFARPLLDETGNAVPGPAGGFFFTIRKDSRYLSVIENAPSSG